MAVYILTDNNDAKRKKQILLIEELDHAVLSSFAWIISGMANMKICSLLINGWNNPLIHPCLLVFKYQAADTFQHAMSHTVWVWVCAALSMYGRKAAERSVSEASVRGEKQSASLTFIVSGRPD